MELLDRAIPKKDLAAGIVTSLLVHVLIFGSAIFAALLIPHKPLPAPYCSVDLVSMKNIGAGTAEPRGELEGSEKAVTGRAQRHARARRKVGPVVPIRRLAVKEAAENIEPPIKQIEPKASPAVPEKTQGVESIDRNLDKLIARPKPEPVTHSRQQVRRAERERESSSSAEREASSNAQSSNEAANEGEGENRAPRGTPTWQGARGAPGGRSGERVRQPFGERRHHPDTRYVWADGQGEDSKESGVLRTTRESTG